MIRIQTDIKQKKKIRYCLNGLNFLLLTLKIYLSSDAACHVYTKQQNKLKL